MATPGGPPPGVPAYNPRPQIRFEAIGEAWGLVQQQLGTWILATLVCAIIGGVVAGLMAALELASAHAPMPGLPPRPALGIQLLGSFVDAAVWIFLSGGMYRMATKQIRGEEIAVGDIFTVTDVFGPLIIAAIIVALATEVGVLLCIIPGLLIAGLLMFTQLLVVDQRLDAMAALSASWNALKPDMVMAALFYVVVSIIAALGVLACFVGLLVTIPIQLVSVAVVYRDFFLASPAAPPPPPIQPPTSFGPPKPPPPPAPLG